MNYLSKIITFILCILLVGCSSNEKIIEEDVSYIEPMSEVFIFDLIDENLQERIKQANNDIEYQNYQFKMLFSKVYDKDLQDINGNVVNLQNYDHLIFDVVSVKCSHCKKIVTNYLNDYLELYPDYTFVQYFDEGNKEDIINFYNDLSITIPDRLIVIERDDLLHDYIYHEVGMQAYPTINFYLNGELRYSSVGELDLDTYDNAIELGFNNPIEKTDLISKDNESLLELDRTIEDVRNSLSKENIEKIESLSEDKYTNELTYKLMGSKCDYDDLLKGNAIYISEIDNFDYYKDKKVVLLYTLLESVEDEYRIDEINNLIASDDSVEYIVVFLETTSSSSNIYKKMNKKIIGAPIVSILGKMPADFYNYGIVAFPSAVYIDKSTFVGAYSKISDVDSFKKSLDIFLSDNSVAYVKNN